MGRVVDKELGGLDFGDNFNVWFCVMICLKFSFFNSKMNEVGWD